MSYHSMATRPGPPAWQTGGRHRLRLVNKEEGIDTEIEVQLAL